MDSRLLSKVLTDSPMGVLVIDQNSRILYINTVLKQLLQLKSEILLGKNWNDYLFLEDREDFRHVLEQCRNGQVSSFRQEFRLYSRGASPVWVRGAFSRIKAKSGEKHTAIYSGFIEDITVQRSFQEELVKARDSAERSAKIKSEFLANMSHEIRTPIHTILGMTDMVLDTVLDEEQQEYVQQVQFSSSVLLDLVNDILDFSRIESGRLQLEAIELDLYDLVERAVDMVSLAAHKKGLETCLHYGPDLPRYFIGDPVRLRQIIVNLFNNAVKFTSEGQVSLSIEKVREYEGKTELKFSVRDSGIGIPPAKLNRLFKVFSQVDSSTTRKFGGSGLGLSISQSLCRMMGGDIGVQSEQGQGSTFWFTILLERVEKEDFFASLPSGLFGGKRILIVDDNEEVRSSLKVPLESWGAETLEADSGHEALEYLRKNESVDLILVDRVMPGMDGWQLASEIHAIDDSLKMVLMSPSGAGPEEAKMKLLRWFESYERKPIGILALFQAVYKALKSSEDWRTLSGETEEELPELESVQDVQAVCLIAEDHPVNQKLFKMILENLGHRVVTASDGAQAVERARERAFDIIFMDVHMPEMNGYEATKMIRQFNPEVPIIAVTASAIKGERDTCLKSGMTDFLTKPFKKKDLKPLLIKYLAEPEELPEVPVLEELAEGAGPGAQVFNWDEVLETFMGREDVVQNVLKEFVPRLDRETALIERMAAEKDWDGVLQTAHSIKGGSRNLSAAVLGDVGEMLEEAARAGDEKAVKEGIPRLLNESRKLVQLLENRGLI